jgi:hypothetical protein
VWGVVWRLFVIESVSVVGGACINPTFRTESPHTLHCPRMSISTSASKHGQNAYLITIWLAALIYVAVAIAARMRRVWGAATPWDVVELVQDDAYYYLTVAANTVETGRTTFDGTTLTNGYQPLWFLLISLLGLLIGTDALDYFRWFYVLICAAFFLPVLLGSPFGRFSKKSTRVGLAVGIAIMAVHAVGISGAPFPGATFLRGMETVLFLPLAIPLVLLLETRLTRRNMIYLSGIIALAFLVRLDSLVLIPAFLVATLFIEPLVRRRFIGDPTGESAWRMIPWVFVISVPVVIVYMLTNFLIYGVAVPVSGLAKAIGPQFANWGIFREYMVEINSVKMFLLAAVLVEVIAFVAGIRSTALLRSIAVLALASSMHALYYAVGSTWQLWPWYYYLLRLVIAVIIARIVILGSELWKRGNFLPAAGIAAVVVATMVNVSRIDTRAMTKTPESAPVNVGTDADLSGLRRSNLSFNDISLLMLRDFFTSSGSGVTRVAMGDRAGGLSYWGRGYVEIFQTEGLVLDYPYIQARQHGTINEYLEGAGINYFVIDRDPLTPVQRADGQKIYVVPEPVGTLLVDRDYHFGLFCFPSEAVRYKITYKLGRQSHLMERYAFEFDKRVDCSPSDRDMTRRTVAKPRNR